MTAICPECGFVMMDRGHRWVTDGHKGPGGVACWRADVCECPTCETKVLLCRRSVVMKDHAPADAIKIRRL